MSNIAIKHGVKTVKKQKVEIQEPVKYKVVMLNDDYTTMDFVVEILKEIFGKSHVEAVALMLEIHFKGSGIAGVFVYDIACSKVTQVENAAKAKGFPLKCCLEKE